MTGNVVEWESYEGGANAYDELGSHVIEIMPLQNRALQIKWGESYRAGREWRVLGPSGEVLAKGNSSDLRIAKREALQALSKVLP